MKKKIIKKPPEKVRVGQKDYFWRNLFYQAVYTVASSPLPEVVFVVALVFSADQPNSYFDYATQVWWPVLLLSAIACLAFLAYRIIFGKGSASHLAALLFSYGFYVYYATGSTTAHALLPKISSTPVKINFLQCFAIATVLAVWAGLITLAARLAIARYSIFKNLQAFVILLLAVALVFAVEIIRFAGRYFSLH